MNNYGAFKLLNSGKIDTTKFGQKADVSKRCNLEPKM